MSQENHGAAGKVRQHVKRTKNDLIAEILNTVGRLTANELDLLDYKIVSTALSEMTEAFELFKSFRGVKKVTMFGSARTEESDQLYKAAENLASKIAGCGWMVVTGAGPGIMAAGIKGAGAEHAIGVNIRLPHEQRPNAFIATDPKLVQMRYFFTRKLMLIKESNAYVFLPGGFGTLDEAFELLTLLQTGKSVPAPVVMLDIKGDTYWQFWLEFIKKEVLSRGYISEGDLNIFKLTDSVDEACDIILRFYKNYHSVRWVGKYLVIRLNKAPSKTELEDLNKRYSFLISDGGEIRKTRPFAVEVEDKDALEFERISLPFDKLHFGELHKLIWELNEIS